MYMALPILEDSLAILLEKGFVRCLHASRMPEDKALYINYSSSSRGTVYRVGSSCAKKKRGTADRGLMLWSRECQKQRQESLEPAALVRESGIVV